MEKDEIEKKLKLSLSQTDDYKAKLKKEISKKEQIEKKDKEYKAKISEQKELIDNFVFLQEQLDRTNQKRK